MKVVSVFGRFRAPKLQPETADYWRDALSPCQNFPSHSKDGLKSPNIKWGNRECRFPKAQKTELFKSSKKIEEEP
jgi:hypothetical protein